MTKIFFATLTAVLLFAACDKKEPAPPVNNPTPPPASDTVPPVITLKGETSDTTSLNEKYTDPGATAQDNTDGDLSPDITVTGSVNENRVGSNYIYYSVQDAAGNSAQVSRNVYVRNDAYRFEGSYNVVSDCGAGFSGLNSIAEVTGSNMHNNRIIITNQQFQSSGFNVTADVNGTSLSMVVQPVGSSLASGTGSISADLKSFTLTTTYTPAIQGSGGCTIVYTKQ